MIQSGALRLEVDENGLLFIQLACRHRRMESVTFSSIDAWRRMQGRCNRRSESAFPFFCMGMAELASLAKSKIAFWGESGRQEAWDQVEGEPNVDAS